jgi:hypothetical protein
MANERGYYGSNGVPRVGATVYVEKKGASIGTWLLGAAVFGGGILYARHQSQQIEKLYKTGGLPYQTFAGSLRESARELPARAREAYCGFTSRVRPAKAAIPASGTEQGGK